MRSLPVQFRWEATRRNPYYQVWWKIARAHYRGEPVQDQTDLLLRQASIAVLGQIGVSGEPIDPAVSFETLEADQLNQGWLSGVAHPISLRGLAGLLIASLPKETVGYVGLLLMEAGCDDVEGEPPRQIKSLEKLSLLEKPGLNAYPDEPFVSINPAASHRQIADALGSLLKQWKVERALGEQRDRSDKYEDYLKAWDLREGWTGGEYDRTQERTFKEIATQLKMSVPTVSNQYRSAFELIVGQPYSPELWYGLVGPIKLFDLLNEPPARVSTRRPLKSPTPRPAPESRLSPSSEDCSNGPVSSLATHATDNSVAELLSDIQELIANGRTDAEIVEELDLSSGAVEAVAYLRHRGEDVL